MIKYLISVLILISGALYFMYFWAGVPAVYKSETLSQKTPHFFGDSARSLANIYLKVFYFVPKNRKERVAQNWKEALEENLNKLISFHNLQFGGASRMKYEIYPEIIFGEEDGAAYDTDVTQHGNPEALKRITEEIKNRGFGGNAVTLIMYEGVGASGADGAVLVSRVFLADPRYKNIGATILAHEFYHALGLPDEYDSDTAVAFSDDIMGLGRERPIEKTYIKKELLNQMGI